MGSVTRHYERRTDADGVIDVDDELARRMALVDKAVGAFSDEIDDGLTEEWRDLRARPENSVLAKTLVQLAASLPGIEAVRDDEPFEPSDEVKSRVETAKRQVERLGSDIEPGLESRWMSLDDYLGALRTTNSPSTHELVGIWQLEFQAGCNALDADRIACNLELRLGVDGDAALYNGVNRELRSYNCSGILRSFRSSGSSKLISGSWKLTDNMLIMNLGSSRTLVSEWIAYRELTNNYTNIYGSVQGHINDDYYTPSSCWKMRR